ncbi:MAG: hypothetical protein Kow0025_15460 [Thermodesulfovibrionales bacterium]
MQELVRLLLIIVIALVAALIVVLFVSAVTRRALHLVRFRRLDRERPRYKAQMEGLIEGGAVLRRLYVFRARPGSVKWQAVEDVVFELMGDARHEATARQLFTELGYVDYYERRLGRRNPIARAAAADKLGRMRSERSIGKLADLFDSGNVELASVAIRAMSKIGSMKALEAVLGKLPRLVDGELAAQKTLTAFLLNFGPKAATRLVGYGWHSDRPSVLAVVLEVLARLGSPEAVPLAVARLSSESPEIRAKALKVISASPGAEGVDWAKVAGLLRDDVWFVRLHAARALASAGRKEQEAASALAELLTDKSWHVRNAAATALAEMGDLALDHFVMVLDSNDPYVKGSLCEELQRTGFTDRLIESLADAGPEAREKIQRVLKVMSSINFRSPMTRYLEEGGNEAVRAEIGRILNREVAA